MPSPFDHEAKDPEYGRLRNELIRTSFRAWHTSNPKVFTSNMKCALKIYKKLTKHPEYKKSHKFGIMNTVVREVIKIVLRGQFKMSYII